MVENYEITDEADRELDKAICYFKFLGKEEEFLDDFLAQIELVIKMPQAFQIKYKNVRIVPLNYFNYAIHYAVFEKTVFVLRIINQSQHY
ncbi:type II toxin-antitoxin system RelE/ParE family toxin [Hyunsoonleella rubra]|uniref:Type II toxin-antitoxin system RelE/ParE family toxin n=1 Tax=Hyunsoonleella rubra TaxID=1737062 RepID=A0ABW5TCI0_9FLAO